MNLLMCRVPQSVTFVDFNVKMTCCHHTNPTVHVPQSENILVQLENTFV